MTLRPRLTLLAVVAIVAVACGSPTPASPSPVATASIGTAACPATPPPQGTPDGWDVTAQRPSLFPQIIDPGGTIACGGARLLFSFLDANNAPIAQPERSLEVKLFDLGADPATPAIDGPATFIWAIENAVGVYAMDVAFPTSGTWGAELTTVIGDSVPETIRLTFDVQPESAVVAVGDQAPASDTPTLADVGGDVAKISTDDQPVDAFYETSVAEAIAAKQPFVLAFATPKFCVTAQCGPTLDRLKPIAAAHPDLTFINVEPYKLVETDGALQPVLTGGQLTPAQATLDWRLRAEPWVFVVDGDGVVSASFMLIFSDEELEAAIAAVE